MFARQGLSVHPVTEQRLGMKCGRHVQRFVVVVGALNGEETCSRVGTDHGEKIREPNSVEAADDVPAFHANVPCVLRYFRQCLDLSQGVLARLLHGSADGERPIAAPSKLGSATSKQSRT